MKYIITSKNVRSGTSVDDAADPFQVTEIATELIITRLYLIHMLNTSIIDIEDTVVCIGDRRCLYTNIFKNVMSFEDYTNSIDIDKKDVIDLLESSKFNSLASGSVDSRELPYLPFYRNWDRDKNHILNVEDSDLSDYDLSSPFLCLVIRKRSAWSEKNMSNDFWNDSISGLENRGIKIFVFGKETEGFCTEKTNQIKTFRDWCSIVKHVNCKHVASTMTGGVYPLIVFGNSNCKMTIIDNTNLKKAHGHDPSFYNSCINFSNIEMKFIENIPTIKEFTDELCSNYINK